MLKFAVIFLVVLIGLLGIELLRPVQELVIIPFTAGVAAVSAWLLHLFDPQVVSQGVILSDLQSGFSVAIRAGCNGVEASIVLIAAILAFPTGWRPKLAGVGIGLLAIQLLNLARIISLFYLGQWNTTAFEWAHLYVWQALIILDVLILFLLWLRFLPARLHEAAA